MRILIPDEASSEEAAMASYKDFLQVSEWATKSLERLRRNQVIETSDK